MKKLFVLLILVLSIQITSYSQTYKTWENENVAEFYEKVAVKNGTLAEDGKNISYVFVPAIIKQGEYEVKIADYKNDLYEIKGTDYYVKFKGFFGFAGYGKEGVLVVGSSVWSNTFYRKP